MDFGSVAVGSSSPAQSFTLVNTGSVATGAPVLTLLGANPGDFAIAAQSCTGSLAPGAACWTKIVFQPTSAATIRSATLTVTDGTTTGAVAASLLGTGSGSPGTGGAGGTGAGGSSASGGAGGAPMGGTGGETGGSGGAGGTAAAALSIYPNSVDYGIVAVGGTSSVQAFTVTNVGNATIGTFSVALSGSSTGEFVISGSTCISVLPVASSCAVAMVFEPNSTGAKSATLVVAGDTATATASLLGIGVSPP